MAKLVNEHARMLSNEQVGPRLHLMVLKSPAIAEAIQRRYMPSLESIC